MSGAHNVTWWGGFDPYTFGVWISEDKIHDFPDPHEIDRLYLKALAAEPDREHREFVGRCATGAERVLAITAFSAYVHEWRHWYDLTSTPFGMARLGQMAAFYATLASLEPVVDDLRKVFVPLERWIRLPDLVTMGFGLGPLPPEAADVLTAAMRVLRKAESARKAIRSISGASVSTHQILESLAMLEQEQHVERHFGAVAATELRRSVLDTGPGGNAYYAAVEMVEDALGRQDRATSIAVLEATLFVDYGVLGSSPALAPPELLAGFLAALRDNPGEDLDTLLDRVVERHQGHHRGPALGHTYEVVSKTLDQILAVGQDPSTTPGAQKVRAHLGVCLKDAFMWGGIARQKHNPVYDVDGSIGRLLAEQGTPARLPDPDPYVLRPPLLIEGYPGRIAKAGEESFFHTLAGSTGPAHAFYDAWGDGTAPAGAGPEDILEQSVVWTPKVDGAPNYLGLLNIFRELMYWRGIVLGPGTISPFTFAATTFADADAKGQQLVGPDLIPAWSMPPAA